MIDEQLRDLPHHQTGHRPNRIQLRAIKRRHKPRAFLTKSRKQARADMLPSKLRVGQRADSMRTSLTKETLTLLGITDEAPRYYRGLVHRAGFGIAAGDE